MSAYIIRRLLLMIPTVILVSLIIFFLMRLLPGDTIDAMRAHGGGDVKLDREALEHEMGLDAPLIVQYGRWMGVVPQRDGSFSGIFQGNLGTSWWSRLTVVDLVALKWPVTLQLGLMGLLIAQLIALPIL